MRERQQIRTNREHCQRLRAGAAPSVSPRWSWALYFASQLLSQQIFDDHIGRPVLVQRLALEGENERRVNIEQKRPPAVRPAPRVTVVHGVSSGHQGRQGPTPIFIRQRASANKDWISGYLIASIRFDLGRSIHSHSAQVKCVPAVMVDETRAESCRRLRSFSVPYLATAFLSPDRLSQTVNHNGHLLSRYLAICCQAERDGLYGAKADADDLQTIEGHRPGIRRHGELYAPPN